jgi:selenocysteine-specific elongation factor|tara:strand:- start:12078 stop:13949 length:1872 start_codon:yes stop_codon:yes gene_type:complete
MSQVVVGMAGHIDHGKTSLVQALTGIDTDSLIEEKKRGMTIDLGFAYLGDMITIIDVPGHEKFIRNMVAGAASTHLALIVIAADDGIMPQTLEHLEILTSLGITKGIVALSKIDLVKDLEWIELVEMDIRELLIENKFELISFNKVDSLSGKGIQSLKNNLMNIRPVEFLANYSSNFRINVDRVFSKIGFGTVLTGTVNNGRIEVGENIEISPTKEKAKIRGIQSHGKAVKHINAGDRVALNLKNVKTSDIKRGTVISTPNLLKSSSLIIIYLKMNKNTSWKIKNKQRLRFYFGTLEVLGRVTLCDRMALDAGERENVIVQLETDICVALDDKFIIRTYSPMKTIAGGVILEINPEGTLKELRKTISSIPLIIEDRFYFFVNRDRIKPKNSHVWEKIFLNSSALIEGWKTKFKLISSNSILYTKRSEEESIKEMSLFLDDSYKKNPFRKILNDDIIITSLGWSEIWLDTIKKKLIQENIIKIEDGGFLKVGATLNFSKKDLELLNRLESIIEKSELDQISIKKIPGILNIKQSRTNDLLHLLVTQNKILEISSQNYIHMKIFNLFIDDLRVFFKNNKILSVSEIKKITGLSRKFVIPLLEYLDQNKFTKRIKNDRIAGDNLNG